MDGPPHSAVILVEPAALEVLEIMDPVGTVALEEAPDVSALQAAHLKTVAKMAALELNATDWQGESDKDPGVSHYSIST